MQAATFEQARTRFLAGVAHFEAGRLLDAEREFAASVALVPGRSSSLTNLGATRLRLGRIAQAAEDLQAAVAADPQNAEALAHLATALAELGHADRALLTAEQALALRPDVGATSLLRAHLLREQGDAERAAAAYREAEARGADSELVRYALAGLAAGPAPAASPRRYVQQLFDSYADGFDEHLVRNLRYRGPQLLVEGLARPRYGHAIDLGCGTGLAGPLLQSRCDRVDGVDLSVVMVERARSTGAYASVTQADVVDYLLGAEPAADLLLAADVLIYIGDLQPLFAAAAHALRPAGEFCFTVEPEDAAADWLLRGSLRYAHAEGYIRRLAGQHGFSVRRMARHPLRLDQGRPVEGLFTWLERPSHAA